jgi:hypothetical protein
LSGDAPGQSTGFYRMLGEVARAYLDRGNVSAAVELYLAWLSRGAGAQTCQVVKDLDISLASRLAPQAEIAKLQTAAAASPPLKAARAQCASTP